MNTDNTGRMTDEIVTVWFWKTAFTFSYKHLRKNKTTGFSYKIYFILPNYVSHYYGDKTDNLSIYNIKPNNYMQTRRGKPLFEGLFPSDMILI